MVTISQQQALKRWDVITPPLREALFSEPNADFVWKTCQAENLTKEMSYEVAGISGYVLLGFIHPEDLADELKDELKLNPQTAKTIADAINQRVFTPLRTDIDKVFQPVSKMGMPKMMTDIGPMPTLKMTTPGPAPLPQTGWSQVKPVSVPTPPKPGAAGGAVGEFARMSAQKGTSGAPTTYSQTPVPPKPSAASAPKVAEPAPFILHQDASFQPLQTKNDFRLSKPDGGASINMAGQKPQAQMAKPAILEFEGKASAPKPQMPASSMTHYTELLGDKTPQVPAASTGPRNISEITSAPAPTAAPIPPPLRPQMNVPPPVPKAPMPMQAPTSIQKPPQPPQVPPGKIVSKDYL